METPVSTPLKYFLARLATDPGTLAEYHRNPDEVMHEAGLSELDRAALKSADERAIVARLDAEGRESPPASKQSAANSAMPAYYIPVYPWPPVTHDPMDRGPTPGVTHFPVMPPPQGVPLVPVPHIPTPVTHRPVIDRPATEAPAAGSSVSSSGRPGDDPRPPRAVLH
jgi:hypothetical protein